MFILYLPTDQDVLDGLFEIEEFVVAVDNERLALCQGATDEDNREFIEEAFGDG